MAQSSLRRFALECYLAVHEFSARYRLCCSDFETVTIQEVFALEQGAQECFLALRHRESLLTHNNALILAHLELLRDALLERLRLFSWLAPEDGPVAYIPVARQRRTDLLHGSARGDGRPATAWDSLRPGVRGLYPLRLWQAHDARSARSFPALL